MKTKIFFIFILFFIFIKSYPIKITKSLPSKTYGYYKMVIPEITTNEKFLLIKAKRNEQQDLLDNIFSDPNLYISTIYEKPDQNHYTWSSSRFGDEIISIDSKFIESNMNLYISVYCEFKCNFILEGELYDKFEMKENKLHTISLIPNNAIKIYFKSRNDYNKLKVNCISNEMRPFRIFFSKSNPSSSNTIKSYPIFYNGYYFEIDKADPEYATNQEYEILIENKEFEQNLLFWITFDNEETNLSELSQIYGVASSENSNCYIFEINKVQKNKNIVISTNLINGSGYIKIGGWEKVKEGRIIREDLDTYPIISDKSIILTENDFKRYNNTNVKYENENNKLHFCFIAIEETSYSMKIYYQENSEKAQKLNYLLPGINSDNILPGKSVTKFSILYFEQNKDINIDLKLKSGEPKLYVYFSYDNINYLNITTLENMKKNKTQLIYSSEISLRNYRIKIDKLHNKCILDPTYEDRKCNIFAVVECLSEINCLYELFFDHVGDTILLRPKTIYSNIITKNEKDLYQININSPKIKNFAVILNQITGQVKLKFEKFTPKSGSGIILENTEKFNQDYMPNVIEIKSKYFLENNIEGIFNLAVIGESFSSYNLYYYTFDDDNSNKLDHKTISMPLIKGQILQDYIKDEHYIKVYSYDNSNIGNNKVDLYIYFSGSLYINYQIYIFKNLDDYFYEKEKVTGYLWSSYGTNYIYISKNDPKYVIGNLYIMIFRKKNTYNYNNIIYREPNSIVSSFSLAITDEITPLSLIEGVEFRQTLTNFHNYQYFYYNHHNHNEDFILSVTIPTGKIKLGLKIGDKDYIYEKIIINNYYLNIKSNEILDYCPSENICNIEIRVEASNLYIYDMDVILLCRSSLNTFIYLKTGTLEKRKILKDEKQYFVIEPNPSPDIGFNINAFFKLGEGILYLKKAETNKNIELSDFPDEETFDYKSIYSEEKSISSINIPFNDLEKILPCILLLTVKGNFVFFGQSEGEYTLSISNIIDNILPNKNYRLFISAGEIKYFNFIIKGNKSRLSISMTNKEKNAYIYLNYGKILDKNIDDFDWKSEGSYNEYIDISIDDPYFISRKIKNLDGQYFLAVRGLEETYFNLFISDLNIKLTTISEDFPGVCNCEKVNDICYFRYENINSPEIAEPMEQDIIFYFDFTYGSAYIYGMLYEDGNNGKIIDHLPNEYNKDYKADYSNQFLRIKLKPGEPKYTLESILVLATKCKDKSLFDFNVRPLITSSNLHEKYFGVKFLYLNKDNIIFISSKSQTPIKLQFFSYNKINIKFEAKAITGSANIHSYIDNSNNEGEDELNPGKVKGYKHLSHFTVEENDKNSHFDTISVENSFRQNVFFEVEAKIDCLFSIYLHYEQETLYIPMNKNIQTQMKNRKLYAYIELLQEYEEIIITVNTDYLGGDFTIYAKINIINSADFHKMLKYSEPSPNNYDIKAKSNILTSSLSVKIQNIPKDLYSKKNKVIVMLLIESNNNYNLEEKINILAYPNVNNYERIFPIQRKYMYSSLSSIKKDKTIFTLKKNDKDDDLLIIEISSCKGDFGFELTENLPINDISKPKYVEAQISESKGKKIILAKIEKNIEYYLSVYGLEEDQMIFYESDKKDIDFLFYYYTIENRDYKKNNFNSKMGYKLKRPGNIILNLPNLQNMDTKKVKLEDLIISVIITNDVNEFNYMNSICYLTKKNDLLNTNNATNNYKTEIHLKKNEIEISNLDPKTYYYINVLITNKKTGQIIALNPLQIMPDKKIYSNFLVIFLISGIIILLLVIFYFYRKYRITKAILNYENKEKKKIGSIPHSINELKRINDNKLKESIKKYNSLTEDSGQI